MKRLLHLYAVVSAYLIPGMRTAATALNALTMRTAVALNHLSMRTSVALRVLRTHLVEALPDALRGRLGTHRSAIVGVLAVALLGVSLGVSLGTTSTHGPTAAAVAAAVPVPQARAAGLSEGITTAQADNAKAIAQVAQERGLPPKAVTIGLATALQESNLNNLDYGDLDSVGLFQQRPSAGWGSVEQIMDPHYAAERFYDHLAQVPDWQHMRVTDAAQTVQQSAFPEAYQKWEPVANDLTDAIVAHHR